MKKWMFRVACLLAFVFSPAAFVAPPAQAQVVTTKYTLTASAWTDLGVGPVLVSPAGRIVFAVADTTPSLVAEGFSVLPGASSPSTHHRMSGAVARRDFALRLRFANPRLRRRRGRHDHFGIDANRRNLPQRAVSLQQCRRRRLFGVERFRRLPAGGDWRRFRRHPVFRVNDFDGGGGAARQQLSHARRRRGGFTQDDDDRRGRCDCAWRGSECCWGHGARQHGSDGWKFRQMGRWRPGRWRRGQRRRDNHRQIRRRPVDLPPARCW